MFAHNTQYLVYLEGNTSYLEYVDPGNVLLVLYSFVCTGFRVVATPTPPKIEDGLFAPVFASSIIVVIVIDFKFGVFGSVTIMVVIVIVVEVILVFSYRTFLVSISNTNNHLISSEPPVL